MLKREWNKIGPAKWKIPFHSTYENLGKSNRKFWSNGTRPKSVSFWNWKFFGGKVRTIYLYVILEHVCVNKFRSTDFYRLLKERIHVLRLRKILIFEQAVANSKMRK